MHPKTQHVWKQLHFDKRVRYWLTEATRDNKKHVRYWLTEATRDHEERHVLVDRGYA